MAESTNFQATPEAIHESSGLSHDGLIATVFVLLNLHLLRNLSNAYLGILLALVLLMIALACERQVMLSNPISRYYLAFMWWTLYVVAISPTMISAGDVMKSAPRIFFVLPIAFIVQQLKPNEGLIRRLLLSYAIFTAIASLTVPLQFVTGPIEWFAESSARSGFDRFATLFGNLTAVGIAGGIGLIVTLLLELRWIVKTVLMAAILSGMLLSLQKAAVMNCILVVGIYSWYSARSRADLARKFIVVCCGAGATLWGLYLAFGPTALATLDNVFRFGGGSNYDDYSLGVSIVQRLWELPGIVFKEYGPFSFLGGVGLIGGGGALGLPDAPQSHNAFFDLIFLGGIVYLLIFARLSWLSFKALREVRSRARESGDALRFNNVLALSGALVLFFANLAFNSGVIFQPNEAILFWLTVGLLGGTYAQHSRLA